MEEIKATEQSDEPNIPIVKYSHRGGDGVFGANGKKRRASRINNPNRLSPHQWSELLGLLKSGHYTQTELAAMYNVSSSAINAKRKALGGIGIGEDSTPKSKLDKIEKTADALSTAMAFSAEEAGSLINEAKRKTFRRNKAIGQLLEGFLQEGFKAGNLEAYRDKVKVVMDIQSGFEKELRLAGICLGFRDENYETAADAPVLTILKMSYEDELREKNKLKSDDTLSNDFLDGIEDPDDYIEDGYAAQDDEELE